jgi:RNA polymerase sigma-70 factor (ECF subfamily)
MSESKKDSIKAAQIRSNPESDTASGELSRLLEQAIERLPENYRTVVMMRDVEEMSTSETAECLSVTEDNVKIRLHRAHGLLRRELYSKAKISTSVTFSFHAIRCDRVVAAVFSVLAALRASDSNSRLWQGKAPLE